LQSAQGQLVCAALIRAGRAGALLAVPSVIIVEEDNVLINPAHPDAKRITATKMRRFVYDRRV
jgi:RES domain-containing protein